MKSIIRILTISFFVYFVVGQPGQNGCSDITTDCLNPSALKRVCSVPSIQGFCRKSCGLCKVDGQWGKWTASRPCSVTCGQGVQKYHRSCDNPAPSHGGANCTGASEKTENCTMQACPAVDGKWSEWRSVIQCTVTCGSGIEYLERSCDNPTPSNGGLICPGTAFGYRICRKPNCQVAVNGQWSSWKVISPCTASCGSGLEYMERTCDNPAPSNGGFNCSGSAFSHRICHRQACPVAVNGQWSSWKVISPCTATCGSGLEYMERACDNPAPSNGGINCSGSAFSHRICHRQACPVLVNGKWSDWRITSPCSVTCGTGMETMERSCDNPAPKNGGSNCSGLSFRHRGCYRQACSVNGSWSNWKITSPCSVTCDTGMETMERSCDNPAPKHGGSNCSGQAIRHRTCYRQACPVNGSWSNWRTTSPCSVTCGTGVETFERSCDNPAPKHGGSNCTGQAIRHHACYIQACPVSVNGGWSNWRITGPCSVTCGTGLETMDRSCDNPAPKHGGSNCTGLAVRQRTCYRQTCPVDGKWSRWGSWSSCSVTCDGGSMSRVRSCDDPEPAHGGNRCVGDLRETRKCNTQKCPSCPYNWVRHDHHCYLIDNKRHLSWHDAREVCKGHNGDLVEIDNKGESDFLTYHVRSLGGSYLTGATDREHESHFSWISNGRSVHRSFSNWCPHQPDDDGYVGEDCVILWDKCGYKWNDDECFIPHYFICELAL